MNTIENNSQPIEVEKDITKDQFRAALRLIKRTVKEVYKDCDLTYEQLTNYFNNRGKTYEAFIYKRLIEYFEKRNVTFTNNSSEYSIKVKKR